MPTVGERLAVVEERVDQMWEWINGGASTRYEDSARGRLHRIMETMNTADKLTEALHEVRRERKRQWTGWQKWGLLMCAAATVAASWYSALAH